MSLLPYTITSSTLKLMAASRPKEIYSKVSNCATGCGIIADKPGCSNWANGVGPIDDCLNLPG